MRFSRRWFKPIPGWPDYWINRKGWIYSSKRKVFLKWFDNIKFYPRVALYNQGARGQFFVHRLVAIVWIPNPNPSKKIEVNHNDWNVGNPHAGNLVWMTPSENKKYNRRKPWRPSKSAADSVLCPF
jgi:hypothetical protein